MKQKQRRNVKGRGAKSVLWFTCEGSVLKSLSCPDAQRGYRHAIERVRGMVLLGTTTVVQQNGCRALSDAPGNPSSRPGHN